MTSFSIHPLDLPLKAPFRISRGVKTEASLVRVAVTKGGQTGFGECCPYPRYGESQESVLEALDAVRPAVEAGAGIPDLPTLLPAGAARNALDCALYDLEAKRTGVATFKRLGVPKPGRFKTFRTVSIDTPRAMAAAARGFARGTPLKVKLDRDLVRERLDAVRAAALESPIMVDANEGWDGDFLAAVMPFLAALGVVLVEQPLPAGDDEALKAIERRVPVLADEACHGPEDLPPLLGKYDAVNIKLDKTGGLTTALALLKEARKNNLQVLLGCMVSSSLSIAPLAHLCSDADFIDLDGPLLLKADPDQGLREIEGTPEVELTHPWGLG